MEHREPFGMTWISAVGVIHLVKASKREQKVAEREIAECRKELRFWKDKYEELQRRLQKDHERVDRCASYPDSVPIGMGDRSIGLSKSVRRRHTYDEASQQGALCIDGHNWSVGQERPDVSSDLNSSLGFCLLLSQLVMPVYKSNRASQDGGDPHHETVSFANYGQAGVGATAATAVSIASAKSWAQEIAGPSNGSVSLKGCDSKKCTKTRFKLVASVPKSNRFLGYLKKAPLSDSDKESSHHSEQRYPFDSLDNSQEAEWVAYGSHLKLEWLSAPKRVLVVYKPSEEVFPTALDAIIYLMSNGIHVYVEPRVYSSIRDSILSSGRMMNDAFLQTWEASTCDCQNILPDHLSEYLDLVVTIGGDGTVLWACSIIGTSSSVPPVVPIAMGSLGFMTPFPLARMKKTLEMVTSSSHAFPIMLRHRLQCRIVRAGCSFDQLGMLNKAPCGEDVLVLNELVIDRGMSASLTNLECYVDSNFVTYIRGDGLIVSTPTGSTAYNLAAGGSMVHPAVPCILFTPICPHTLSSRPLVFPEHVILRLRVPMDSRGDLYCSFDGKSREPLSPGDSVVVHVSQLPVPMVCNLDASHDWFMSVREGLNWNQRITQK